MDGVRTEPATSTLILLGPPPGRARARKRAA
jgi:hypothetical protein